MIDSIYELCVSKQKKAHRYGDSSCIFQIRFLGFSRELDVKQTRSFFCCIVSAHSEEYFHGDLFFFILDADTQSVSNLILKCFPLSLL